ncbi:prolactin-releasing peptide receptor-like [Schistocerca serialis cubense]|uniref:prolactin-releasing peptide receptor-like n=1 Tax=Schistocerca serialis cubense TaxID=2023355 RepID=UPI00214E3FD0|nr:prolactin-releasing peptide receptor-like [Schistocerca serialis cubense]
MEDALFDKHHQFGDANSENVSTAGNGTWAYLRHDVMQTRAVQAVFGVVYCVIFALGTPGNLLVCYTVYRNRAMRTVTNLYICALALADVLLCGLCLPFTPLYTFLGGWVFGGALCHAVAFSQCFSVYVTALTLTAIAVDRFYVIVHPFRPRMPPSHCLAVEGGVVVFSVLATLPYGVYMATGEVEGVSVCNEAWPSEAGRRAFLLATFCLQFVLPLSVIACCYGLIALCLARQSRARPGAKSSRREATERERKRRTNRLLVAMVLVFAACWLPLNAVNMVADLDEGAEHWRYFTLCFFLAHALAMSSVCYNPLLYAWLNDNFRKELKQLVPCCRRRVAAASCGTTSTAGQSAQTLLQTSACPGQHLPDVVAADAEAPAPAPAAVYTVADDQVHLSGISSGGTEEVSCT